MNKEELIKIKEKVEGVDKLFRESIKTLVNSADVRTKALTSKLGISEFMAQCLIFMMQEIGIVSEENEKGERTMLVSQEEINEILEENNLEVRKHIDKERVAIVVADLGRFAELFEKSVREIVDCGCATASRLRRKFMIGYPLAMKMIGTMEDLGFISASYDVGKRDIYITKQDVDEIFGKKEN